MARHAKLNLDAMRRHAGEASDLLKALANPQRLRLLCLLIDGELSVGELNRSVKLSQSALSQHLSRLRVQGLVTTRREAQTILYSLIDGPARDVIGILHDTYCAGSTQSNRRSARR
jgi:DNA-binding transcriptional ArsR family regulator